MAAALSQGGTTSQGHLKYRDVFLGSGVAPLHALLNKPQVIARPAAPDSRGFLPLADLNRQQKAPVLNDGAFYAHLVCFVCRPEGILQNELLSVSC